MVFGIMIVVLFVENKEEILFYEKNRLARFTQSKGSLELYACTKGIHTKL